MPTSVLGAIAGSVVADLVVGETIAGLVVSQLGSKIIGGVAGTLVSSVVGAAFADEPDQPQGAQFEQQQTDNLVTIRQPIAHWQYIYGRTRVGGALTFAHQSEDGNLHLVITYAGHVCQEIEAVQFNEETVPLDGSGNATGRYAGYVRIQKSLGDEAGQPFPDLVTETVGRWGDDWRQSGRTKLYVRLTPNADLFPTGIPNITCVIKGKKHYDPRSALTAYTDNASVCIAGFLCDTVWLGATYATEIDETQLIAAANIDDEAVSLVGGGTEARYTLNGAFTVNTDSRTVLQRLLSANAGRVHYLGGVFRIVPAAYVSPSLTFTEADLRGVPQIEPRLSAADLCNGVKGVYVSEDNLWQPSDFPAVTNATYLTEDGGERSWRELDLPFTKSAATAQRIAKIELERTRQQISVVWPGKLTCYRAQPGDVQLFTFAMMGWTAKAFEIVSGGLTLEADENGVPILGSDLLLRETASTVFDWSTGEETTVDPAPDTDLPNPFVVGAPANVAAYSGTDELLLTGDGTVISRMRVVWDLSPSKFVTSGGEVLVRWKKASDSVYQDLAPVNGTLTMAWVSPVDDGELYDVRVRFRNSIGVRSDVTQISHTVVGKTAPPSDVTQFTIEGTRLTWAPVADADVIGYRLRWGPGVNRDWGSALALHQGLLTASPFDMLVRPSGVVTLLCKAVDFSGNESLNPAVIYANLGDAVVANVVETFDLKAAGFVGTITNGTVSGGNLVADVLASPLAWNPNDAVDAWSWDSSTLAWATTMYKAMTYVESLTITAALAGSRMTIDYAIAGDPWTIEYRENSQKLAWDADPNKLAWSADDTALAWDSPLWQPWPGEVVVTNTIIDLRVTTGQATTQGVISTLTVTIDAPDLEETLNDVVIAGAGTRLTLTAGFSVIKNVQLTVQNDAGTAISARTEDKNAALGPLVKCLDAAGAATTGLIDARVQGY